MEEYNGREGAHLDIFLDLNGAHYGGLGGFEGMMRNNLAWG
jgi:hypothetical protein